MTATQILVPLAPGFEETEAVTIIDVLRRAELEVVVAGLEPGPIEGSHGITIQPDVFLGDVADRAFGAVVLPGGMPGSQHLTDHDGLQALVKRIAAEGGWTAAICAAPMALGAAGLTAGKAATCFPGFEDRLIGGQPREERVVIDGRLVTSRGVGTALEFALVLVEQLVDAATADALGQQMLVSPRAPAFEA